MTTLKWNEWKPPAWMFSMFKWSNWINLSTSAVRILFGSWCLDDLLKMFDELIIPAARLLDTVETKIKDYKLTHDRPPSTSPPLPSNQIERVANIVGKKSKIVLSHSHPTTSTPQIFPSVCPVQRKPIPCLAEYKTIVYEETDVLDWSRCSHNRSSQSRQVTYNFWSPHSSIGRGRSRDGRGNDRLWKASCFKNSSFGNKGCQNNGVECIAANGTLSEERSPFVWIEQASRSVSLSMSMYSTAATRQQKVWVLNMGDQWLCLLFYEFFCRGKKFGIAPP